MFVITLILLFIIKLRFRKGKSIVQILQQRYGKQVLTLFRECERVQFKLKKVKCDIDFLELCLSNSVTPNFVNFKLYHKRLRNTSLYKSFQKKLLEEEINTKKKQEKQLNAKASHLFSNLQASTSWIDFSHLLSLVNSSCKTKIDHVKLTHNRKLSNLGIDFQPSDPDYSKYIFNYSSKLLTDKEKEVLSKGLKFGLPPRKINYHKFFCHLKSYLKH